MNLESKLEKCIGRREAVRPQIRAMLWMLAAALLCWAALHRLITQAREVGVMGTPPGSPGANVVNPAPAESGAHPPTPPSAELLRSRALVAQLTRELGDIGRKRSPDASMHATGNSELDRLLKGRRPSEAPDFVRAESIRNRGFSGPDEALETFYWNYAGPGRLKDFDALWWSPSEPAGEGYHYELGLGHGFSTLRGYRVASREQINADEVLFRLQREEQHGVIEEEARFVRTPDGWKRKPEVRRVRDAP
ncbi:MAG: hypothetical protein U1G08_04600 [Verrucomicrobiota bacterium]